MAMNPYGSFQGGRPQGPPGSNPMGGRPMAPPSSSGPYSGMLPFAPPPTSGYSSAPPPPLLGRPPFGVLGPGTAGMTPPRFMPPPFNPMMRPPPIMQPRPPSMLQSPGSLSRPMGVPSAITMPRPMSLPPPTSGRPGAGYSLAEMAARAVRQLAPLPLPEKPHTTVYVGKIAPTVDEAFLKKILELCGPIKVWKRAQDPSTLTPKGFGFCEFESAEGVLRALRLLNKLSLEGQELVLNVDQATRDYLERYVMKKRQVATGPRIDKEDGTPKTSKPEAPDSKTLTVKTEEITEVTPPVDDSNHKVDIKSEAPGDVLMKESDVKESEDVQKKKTMADEEMKDKEMEGPPGEVEVQSVEGDDGQVPSLPQESEDSAMIEQAAVQENKGTEEVLEDIKEKVKETDEEAKEAAARTFGLVLLNDREIDEAAIRAIKAMVEERVKLLPPPPPSLSLEVSAALKAAQKLKERSENVKPGDSTQKTGDSDSEQKVSAEVEKEDVSSADRRKRERGHRERDRDRERVGEHDDKETEYARIERERERERTRRERDRERSHRDAERIYGEREREWEAREREKERQKQHDRDRERERERERRRIIKEQEEESEDEEWRRRHGYLGEEAARRRAREAGDDELDALKEEQEISEAKRRRIDEEAKTAIRIDAVTAVEAETRATKETKETSKTTDKDEIKDEKITEASVPEPVAPISVKVEIPPVVLPPPTSSIAVSKPNSPAFAILPPVPLLSTPATLPPPVLLAPAILPPATLPTVPGLVVPSLPLTKPTTVIPEEAPLPVPVAATLVRAATAQAREREMEVEPKRDTSQTNGRSAVKIEKVEKESSPIIAETARAVESKKKLGFGLAGSGKLALAAAFGEEDDDKEKSDKRRPLVPIDYEDDMIGGSSPKPALSSPGHGVVTSSNTISGGDGIAANIAKAAEYAKRLSRMAAGGSTGPSNKESKEGGGERKQQEKTRISEAEKNRKEDSKKTKGVDSKPFKDAKSLIDTIPKTKEELFSYPVDWNIYDKHNLHLRMRPWIDRKIKEFLGEEEKTLVDFIVRNTQEHVTGASMLELVEPILDDEAEMFVLKLWRMLIFEIRRIETGLSNHGK